MKKITALIICVFILCSCSPKKINNENKFSVVCTVFPAYDWVKNLSENTNTEVLLIPSNGTDIHSYQPSADDIIRISECDLFIYSSAGEKAWYDDIKLSDKKKINICNFIREDHIKDEHVWMSPEAAADIVEELCEKLVISNPEYVAAYEINEEIYEEKLEKLDDSYEKMLSSAGKKAILVADRFPFHHMTEEYNIRHFSAFEGCSADSEVSFETIAFLSQKADEYNINTILTAEDSDNKIAEAIIKNLPGKEIKILALNSMQSVSLNELENDINYINVMENNLKVLGEALN